MLKNVKNEQRKILMFNFVTFYNRRKTKTTII